LIAASIGERIRRIARSTLPKPMYVRGAVFLDNWYGVQKFGFDGFRKVSAIGKSPAGGSPTSVHLRPLAHPFFLRPGTPDAGVVLHAMARETYGYKLPSSPVNLIIDAGANIGDTSVWYATRFPKALVIAIEPDAANLSVLQKNCAPYGKNIQVMNAALWPVPKRSLVMSGAFVGTQVREEPESNGSNCPSIDPMTILRDSGRDTIDIFKIDIEGAELALFSEDCDPWLSRTRNIAIEIHSPEAREAVLSATKRNGFKHAIYRDLYVFWK
jgi:FkbM family methyltransferase